MATPLSRQRAGIIFAVPLPRGGFAYGLSLFPFACFYDFITTHCTSDVDLFKTERLRFPVDIWGKYSDGVIDILDLGSSPDLPTFPFFRRGIDIFGDLSKPLFLRYEGFATDGVVVDEHEIEGLEERVQIQGDKLHEWIEAHRNKFEFIETPVLTIQPLKVPRQRATKDSLSFLRFEMSRLKSDRLPSDLQDSLDEALQEKELGLVMGGGFFDSGECDVCLEIQPGKVKRALRAITPILKEYSEIPTIDIEEADEEGEVRARHAITWD
jgi:hypothetical protein